MRKVSTLILALAGCCSTLYAQVNPDELFAYSLEELKEVEITVASKTRESWQQAPAVITVMSRDEILAQPARNLGELLGQLVGSQYLNANYFTNNVVQLRGQSITPYNNHVLLLWNGRPLRDPIAGGLNAAIYQSFPLQAITRIEVIRGPGSVLYGSCAFSGVVNIVTSTHGKGFSASAEATAGSDARWGQEVHVRYHQQETEVLLSLYNMQEEGPEWEFTDNLNQKQSARFSQDNRSAMAHVTHKNWQLHTGYWANFPYALAGADLNWDDEHAHANNNQQRLWADIGYSHPITDQDELSMHVTYNQQFWEIEAGEQQQGRAVLGELMWQHQPADKLQFLTGITGEWEDYQGSVMQSGNQTIVSAYAQMQYPVTTWARLVAGMQWNKPERIAGNWSPRLALLLQASDSLGGKLLYSEAFRRAYPLEAEFDLPVFRGNPMLQPELIHTFEAQGYYRTQLIQASLTGFYSRMTQLISRKIYYTSQGDFDYLKYINDGRMEYWGIESTLKTQLGKRLMLAASYAFQENQNKEELLNAALHANHLIKMAGRYQRRGVSLGLQGQYSSAPYSVRRVNPDYRVVNPEPDDYFLLSSRIEFYPLQYFNNNFNSEWALWAEGYNLLNQEVWYPEYTTREINSLLPLTTGRQWLMGLRISW